MRFPEYQEVSPSRELSEVIHCYWEYNQEDTQNATSDIVFDSLPLGLPECLFFISGHGELIVDGKSQDLSSAIFAGIQLTRKFIRVSSSLHLFGIAFKPFGLVNIVPAPLRRFTDRLVPVADVSPFLNELFLQIGNVDGLKERVAVVNRLIETLLESKPPRVPELIKQANDCIIAKRGLIKTTSLARTLGISVSSLQRNFDKYLGLYPKQYVDAVRFAEILSRVRTSKISTDLTEESNFFDQAHFIKDFRNYLYVSPEAANDLQEIRQYITAQLDAPVAAQKLVSRILKSMRGLADFPESGPNLSSVLNIETDYRFQVRELSDLLQGGEANRVYRPHSVRQAQLPETVIRGTAAADIR